MIIDKKIIKKVTDAYSERYRYKGERYYLWNKYPQLENIYNKISSENPVLHSNPWVVSFMKPSRNKKLLDFGCGFSLFAYHFKAWECNYFGVDICKDAIRTIYSRNWDGYGPNVKSFLYCNGSEIPFPPNFFHLVVCIGVIEYYQISDAKIILKELSRVCKGNGKLYINIPNIRHQNAEKMLLIEKIRGCPNYLWEAKKFEKLLQETNFQYINKSDNYLMIHYLANSTC